MNPRVIVASLAAVLLAAASAGSVRASPPPNIIVILADDLGYGDIGPFGATAQRTPHLDRMAAEGMKLTSFYAAPVCSVSRAQVLTGCYGLRVGVPGVYFPAGPEGLNPSEVTLAERLKTLGYATACIGKWHLGDQPAFLPTRQGFDRYYGIPYSNDMQRVSAETGQRVVPLLRDETVEELLTDQMQTAIVANSTAEAVRFIEDSKAGPFFLYMPHTAVHAPLVPGDRFRGTSRNGPFGDWVEELDWSVGEILQCLRRCGIDDDTLVVFTSDNGPWVGVVGDATTAGPLRGSKGSTWEGGVRVPAIAWWPGRIAPGTTSGAVAGTIDLLPTCVHLAGGTVPPDPVIDGRDLSGLLVGTSRTSPRDAHYYFLGDSLQAVRKGRWKLVIAPQRSGMGRKDEQATEPASPQHPRLYDLEADVGETTDVAADHPEVVADLRPLAVAMQEELGQRSPSRRPAGRVESPRTIYPTAPQPRKQERRSPQGATPSASSAAKPNIVLFLADDLGYGELGCYGNRDAVTPHLDRFAATGLRLTDCHSAGSVCSPSRSSLLTGRTPYRNGVFTWIPENSPIHLRTSEVALPGLLKAAGYQTCHVGKWHLNGLFNTPQQPQPADHGYEWWLATQNNAAPSHAFPENFVRNGTPLGRVDGFSAPFIVREAATWLKTERDPSKPFFLTVWTHEPHYPIASAERYEKQHAHIADPEERTYRANVTQLDDAFGTLMQTLDEIGVADSTLVFFTSDNGPEGAGDTGPGRGLAGPLRGRKRSMYEGGHRVPGIIRWPAKMHPEEVGKTSDLPVIGSDFFPTALRAAGLEPPPGRTLDGVDISGPAVHEPRPLYWRWGGFVAYREGPWKIVTDEGLEKPQLYNLSDDLAETTDLAAREPDRLAAMMQRLRALTADVEAEGPVWWKEANFSKKQAGSKEKPRAGAKGPDRPRKPARVPTPPSATSAAPAGPSDEDLSRYALFLSTAPRPPDCEPQPTTLPLVLERGDRICLIGNTLLERAALFGHVPATIHAGFPDHELVVRTLAWSADEIDLAPRPDNFADLEQHLFHERADVILAAYGANESFAGEAGLPAFRERLAAFLERLKGKAFNGETPPRIVMISPIPNENVAGVAAADRNNANLRLYADAMRSVAADTGVGFVDAFAPLEPLVAAPGDLTINGCHLTAEGYASFAGALFEGCFGSAPARVAEPLREAVVDLERQFFRRYRPLNTFYYTGGRNKDYGYLDFLPAMRNFEILCGNRDRRIWDLAHGRPVPDGIDDSNVPPLPPVQETRGANEWLPAEEERKAFRVDPRFEVNLFAGEEQFPEIANPIQARWDSRGRMWVCTSQAYPHVYPGMEPHDRLVILEDVDHDGRADTSKVFADDLHVPLSFEFGDGGVYVSEQPHLTFLADTDGDDRADVHEVLLSGFGTEDSHHSLHDFIWTPDGALLFRESIFHHTQVETPYGPVRQRNSGWFRYEPRNHRLSALGSYPSTNPWGVAFDPWGNHVASHPIFAEAFHALDPPYPGQHAAPTGLQAYSGTCGQAFVDCPGFPQELQGGFLKARYKPTNRIEIHRWMENDFGFDEQYVGDLLFSTNLSFIPVDLHFGPRGDLFVVDWYNPVKGHAQYSLRDSRRDRTSGRIWRVTAKGATASTPPDFADASETALADLLGHREFRVRYLATRELTRRPPEKAVAAITAFAAALDVGDPASVRHKAEAMAALSTLGHVRPAMLAELANSSDHHARAAAIRQLRFWHDSLPDRHEILARAAADPSGLVRLEAAIAASWIGTPEALESLLHIVRQPLSGHLAYAAVAALESAPMARHWREDPASPVPALVGRARRSLAIREPRATAAESDFDRRADLVEVRVGCEPERMLFTNRLFRVQPGQSVKLVFINPDATDHNLVIVKPGALEEVGVAANEMARDPKHAAGDFLPESKRDLLVAATPMIGPSRKALSHVLRFEAPTSPGVYPFVCTFPGHWIVMNGQMVVAESAEEAESLLAACRPAIVRTWTLADFPEVVPPRDEAARTRGLHAFTKARCIQCHTAAGLGVALGPNLAESVEKLRGRDLLSHLLDPSLTIPEAYRTVQFILSNGRVESGVVAGETPTSWSIRPNLLTPEVVKTIPKSDVEERIDSRVSPMPAGLLNVLTHEEIIDLLGFLESGPQAPLPLRHTP